MSVISTQIDVRPCEVCGKRATKVIVQIATDGESEAISKCACAEHLDQVQAEADKILTAYGFEGDG
jgi:hypothetical protein